MKAIQLCFFQMICYMKKDMMLFAAFLAPFLIGIVFKFVIPLIESLLSDLLSLPSVLEPYYKVFDIFFSMIAPTMLCFVSSMVSLEEKDEKTSAYLFITPLRKKGYLFSRLGVPSLIAFLITIILLPLVRLTSLSFMEIVSLSLLGALQGLIISLLILTLSSNKLEGVAISKLSSIIIVGAFIPFFIQNNSKFIFSFLPSFWIGLSISSNELIYMTPAIILSITWITILLRLYIKKI